VKKFHLYEGEEFNAGKFCLEKKYIRSPLPSRKKKQNIDIPEIGD